MIAQANTSYSKLEAIGRHVEQHFSRLLSNLKNTARLQKQMHGLAELVESLPLGTQEYDVTMARINNVLRYLESGETGAAAYEVRQLTGGLRTSLQRNDRVVFEEVDDAFADGERKVVLVG